MCISRLSKIQYCISTDYAEIMRCLDTRESGDKGDPGQDSKVVVKLLGRKS